MDLAQSWGCARIECAPALEEADVSIETSHTVREGGAWGTDITSSGGFCRGLAKALNQAHRAVIESQAPTAAKVKCERMCILSK